MKRQTKILFVIAFMALGLGALVFWPEQNQGDVSIRCAGVSANDSNPVSFTITNSFKNSRTCRIWTDDYSSNHSTYTRGKILFIESELSGLSQTNVQLTVPSTNRWRTMLFYSETSLDSMTYRTRMTLGKLADKMNSTRLASSIWPKTQWKEVIGPIMLGNKPAPPEQK